MSDEDYDSEASGSSYEEVSKAAKYTPLRSRPAHRDFSCNRPSLQEAALAAETLKRGAELADAAQPRLAIYNTDALHDKLEDISWTTEQPWEETQVCSSKRRLSSTWLSTS